MWCGACFGTALFVMFLTVLATFYFIKVLVSYEHGRELQKNLHQDRQSNT